jgi:transcriptional regulator with XRE-family HTH domain
METTLKDELERIRAGRGWSIERMAVELRIATTTYRHLLSGRNRAGRKVLGGVALAFPEVNIAWFAAQDIRDATTVAVEAPSTAQDTREGGIKYVRSSEAANGPQEAKSDGRAMADSGGDCGDGRGDSHAAEGQEG